MPEVPSGTAAPLSRRAVGEAAGRISLPKPLTSFIGRERELEQAKRLLQGSYLVTLTGPGGSGKTRLCIAVAGEVAGDYPDGRAAWTRSPGTFVTCSGNRPAALTVPTPHPWCGW